MKISIKICGISSIEILRKLETLNIDYIGFIFYEKSKRYIDAKKAEEISKSINSKIKIIGVFVDPSDNYIAKILNRVPLSGIQLHGKETPNRIKEIKNQTNILTIKAIPIEREEDLKNIEIYNDVCDYFLLDKKNISKTGFNGGTGENFDWNIISRNKNWLNQFKPWILSGGLNIYNIKEAIEITGTKAIDVSSGIEYNTGIKSIELMDLFVKKIYRKNSEVRE